MSDTIRGSVDYYRDLAIRAGIGGNATAQAIYHVAMELARLREVLSKPR